MKTLNIETLARELKTIEFGRDGWADMGDGLYIKGTRLREVIRTLKSTGIREVWRRDDRKESYQVYESSTFRQSDGNFMIKFYKNAELRPDIKGVQYSRTIPAGKNWDSKTKEWVFRHEHFKTEIEPCTLYTIKENGL